jgi:hypothetical protein
MKWSGKLLEPPRVPRKGYSEDLEFTPRKEMSNQLRYAQWQEPFRNALTAFGTRQLSERVKEVELMILDRLQELSSDIKSLDERQALLDAIAIIRVLSRHKGYV